MKRTLGSIAFNIFQKCYSLPKPEDHEIQKLRVIETAAKLIQTDIKEVETKKDIHPSAEDRLLKNAKLICQSL